MTTINRRTALAGIPACALAPVVPAVAEPADPLLDLIRGYRSAMQEYNATPIDLADEDNPYFPGFADRYHSLCNEPPMPTTMTGAIEAIRLVVDEEEGCGNQPDLTIRVLRAALAYLDNPNAA